MVVSPNTAPDSQSQKRTILIIRPSQETPNEVEGGELWLHCLGAGLRVQCS